jgi:hypothetical protein
MCSRIAPVLRALLANRDAPAAKLAVTRPIKFAVDKKNLYLMNENGEEYQTKILKQVERDPQK